MRIGEGAVLTPSRASDAALRHSIVFFSKAWQSRMPFSVTIRVTPV